MQRITLDGRYPLSVEEIAKADTRWRDVDEIAAALRARIHGSHGAAFVGVFDHYGLNLRMAEPLPISMQDAKTILFCFGSTLPDPAFLALSPCAIGVADMGNRFVISFLDAIAGPDSEAMTRWIEDLRAPQSRPETKSIGQAEPTQQSHIAY